MSSRRLRNTLLCHILFCIPFPRYLFAGVLYMSSGRLRNIFLFCAIYCLHPFSMIFPVFNLIIFCFMFCIPFPRYLFGGSHLHEQQEAEKHSFASYFVLHHVLYPFFTIFPVFFHIIFCITASVHFLRHEIDSSMLQQSCNVQFFQLTSSTGAPSAVRFFSIYFLIPFLIAQC